MAGRHRADYKGRRVLKTYFLGVSSHLLPVLHFKLPPLLGGGGFCVGPALQRGAHGSFYRKVDGVVDRAALEMR